MANRLERIPSIESFQVPEGFELVAKANGFYNFSEVKTGEEVIVLGEMKGRGKGNYTARGIIRMIEFDLSMTDKYIVLNGEDDCKKTIKSNQFTVYSHRLRNNGRVYRKI